ncbi:MAG: hypothetical protein JNK12_00280 [Acidimicrobiales bacterium]|nr:hypothetical protein [Acidimicrobiales bacterium]
MPVDPIAAWSWGYNGRGYLGVGTASLINPGELNSTSLALPVHLPGDVTDVSAGHDHVLAVREDGDVWAWGKNAYREVAAAGPGVRSTPGLAYDGGDAVRVTAGREYSLALLDDGTVVGWGRNDCGQLGRGSQTTSGQDPGPVPDLDGVVSIAAGEESLAVLDDGTVWHWGHPTGDDPDTSYPCLDEPVQVAGLSDIVEVSTGTNGGNNPMYQTLALDADGALWAWGYMNGLEGVSGFTATPTEITGLAGEVVDFSVGVDHSLALLDDGTVWGWGGNFMGQLGGGTTSEFEEDPVQAGISGVVDVSAGAGISLAIDSGGRLWSWGHDYLGGLANGNRDDNPEEFARPVPTRTVGMNHMTMVSAGGASFSVALGTISTRLANMLGVSPTGGSAADPVNTGTGSFYDRTVDLAAPGGSYGLEWSRTYNAMDELSVPDPVSQRVGVLGVGWTTPLDVSLREMPWGLELRTEDGRRVTFTPDPEHALTWLGPVELYATVTEDTGASTRTVLFDSGELWTFDLDGRLLGKDDGQGHSVDVTYQMTAPYTAGGLVAYNGSSEAYSIGFADSNADGLIDTATGPDGAEVDYLYEDGRLVWASQPHLATEDPGGETFTYYPTTHQLETITTAVAESVDVQRIHNDYDDQGRVVEQVLSSGDVATFDYEEFNSSTQTALTTVTHDDGDGSVETVKYFHDVDGRLLAVEDPFNQSASWTWLRDQLDQTDDRSGARTDPTFDTAGRLTRVDLPDPDIAHTTEGWIGATYCNESTSSDPRVLSVTAADGTVTEYTYGADTDAGYPCVPGEFSPSSVTTAAGTDAEATTEIGPDTAGPGLPSFTEDADGVRTDYSWDGATGQLLASTIDDDMGQAGVQTTYFGYDAAGRPQVVRTPLGNETWTVYDGAGRVSEEIGPVQVSRTCGASSCEFGSTPPAGPTIHYTYWLDGSLHTRTDQADKVWTYERDYLSGGGWTDTETEPDPDHSDESAPDIRVSTYDAAGNLVQEQVGDSSDSENDPLATTTHTYSDLGRLERTSSPEGVLTFYRYDESGRLTETTAGTDSEDPDDPAKTGTTDYDLRGRVTDVWGPQGDVDQDDNAVRAHTHYEYDSADRVIETVEGDGADARRTWTHYDEAGRVQYEITDLNGDDDAPDEADPAQWDHTDRVVEYRYTDAGRLAAEVHPPVDAASYEWGDDTAEVQIVTVIAPGGTFRLEFEGHETDAVSVDAPASALQDALLDLPNVFDGDLTVTGDDGGPYTVTWASERGDVGELDGGGEAAEVETTTEGFGPTVTRYRYDDAGQQTDVIAPGGPAAHTDYDADGRVESETSPGGATRSYAYDPAGRVVSTTTPSPTGTGTAVATSTYTDRGELATSTEAHDPADTSYPATVYSYYSDGTLRTVADPRAEGSCASACVVTYGYDGRNNRTHRTTSARNTPAGSVHSVGETWEYNLDDHVTGASRTGAAGPTLYSYADDNGETGRLSAITRPSGRVEARTYWASGLVHTTTSTLGEDDVTVEQWYDDHGQRTQMTDPQGDTTYTWDRTGQITDFTMPGVHNASYSYRYTYDLEGRPVGLVYNPAHEDHELSLRGRHDRLGRMTNSDVYVPQIDMWWPAANYSYDDDGRVTHAGLNNEVGDRNWGYPANRGPLATSYEQWGIASQQIQTGLAWRHDGRRASEDTNGYTAEYSYDEAGQLLSRAVTGPNSYASTTGYTYDPRGVRLTETVDSAVTGYTSNDLGQITLVDPPGAGADTTYSYDDDGRRTQVTDGTDTDATTYDPRGLPTTIEHETASGTAITDRTYDGDGRLTGVSTDDHDFDLTWDPTRAVPQVLENYLGEDTWSRSVFGNERVGYEFLVNNSTVAFGFYSYNYDGSTLPAPDAAAPVGYGPYGTPSHPPDSPMWPGYRAELHLDGLIHLRNRDYDPTTGTFTTPDPLDSVDGTPTVGNPYPYANNDPTNRTDPLGLRASDSIFGGRQIGCGLGALGIGGPARCVGIVMPRVAPDATILQLIKAVLPVTRGLVQSTYVALASWVAADDSPNYDYHGVPRFQLNATEQFVCIDLLQVDCGGYIEAAYRSALNAAIEFGTGSGLGPANAFQHALWSFHVAERYGLGSAAYLLAAHENIRDQDQCGRQMDVHNDGAGLAVSVVVGRSAVTSGLMASVEGPYWVRRIVDTDLTRKCKVTDS